MTTYRRNRQLGKLLSPIVRSCSRGSVITEMRFALTEVDVDAWFTDRHVPSATRTVETRHGVADPGLTLPRIAIPTVLIWFGALALWLAATTVVLIDLTRWKFVVTIPAHVVATYAMFTVLHDSIHGTVGRAKWANELFGRLSMPFLALWGTFPVMRYIHGEHHRNTNEDPRTDPDAWAHTGPSWQLPLRWLTIDAWYARFAISRLRHRPRKEIVGVLIDVTVLVTLFSTLIWCGHGWDLALIYLLPQRLAQGILAWWFDFLPHHDLGATAKIDAVRASRVRVGWERVMNPLMFNQNFHVVHHIHPQIPFYLWVQTWKRTEAHFLERGVPISTAWGSELTPSQYRRWRKIDHTPRADGHDGLDTMSEQSSRGREDFTVLPRQTPKQTPTQRPMTVGRIPRERLVATSQPS
jgi:beta-carotene hydroxylase